MNNRPLWRVSVTRPIPPQLFVIGVEFAYHNKTAFLQQSGTYISHVNTSGEALLSA